MRKIKIAILHGTKFFFMTVSKYYQQLEALNIFDQTEDTVNRGAQREVTVGILGGIFLLPVIINV